MSITVTLGGIDEPIEAKGVTVEVAEVFGQWVAAPFLHCRSLQLRTRGEDSVAMLVEHAGQITPVRGHASQPHYPSLRPLQFIRLTVPFHDYGTAFTWVGIVTHQTDVIGGTQGTVKYRDQTYVVHGIEWMLHREIVYRSEVRLSDDSIIWLDRAIPFNGRDGRGGASATLKVMNRTADPVGGVHSFAIDAGSGRYYWNAWEVLKYIERHYQPFSGWTWTVDAAAENMLDWFTPVNFEVHGQSVREIVSALIGRSRTLDHYWEWSTSLGKLVLYVQSHNVSALTLPSGDVVPVNSQVVVIDSSTRQRSEIILTKDYSSRFDQVVAEGDYITSTFAIDASSGSLVPDWYPEDEESYAAGASAMAGYASLDKDAKAARNDLYRMTGQARRVWTRYKVPTSWNGRNAYGEVVFPWVSIDGVNANTDITSSVLVDTLRLSLQTLIPTVDNDGDVETLAEEYDSGLVFVKVPIKHRGQDAQVYCKISELSTLAKSETAGQNGIGFSVSARAYSTGPGLFIEPSVPATVLALGRTTDADQPSDVKPVIDWQTIVAVVTAEADERVRVAYPKSPAPTRGQIARLIINLHGKARLDYLADETPVGVQSDGTLRRANGEWLRDDRPFLRNVARMAYEWYQVDRQLVRFQLPYISGLLLPADLIAVIDDEAVNTIITAITYDFASQTTQIETGTAEQVDFAGLVIA